VSDPGGEAQLLAVVVEEAAPAGRLARAAPPAPGQTIHLGRVEPLVRFLP
jgi:hypothetical protein